MRIYKCAIIPRRRLNPGHHSLYHAHILAQSPQIALERLRKAIRLHGPENLRNASISDPEAVQRISGVYFSQTLQEFVKMNPPA